MIQFRRLAENDRNWGKFKTSITLKFDLIKKNKSNI